MKKQLEALKVLWPILVGFAALIGGVLWFALNAHVDDRTLLTLKGDAAKQYLTVTIDEILLGHGIAKDAKIVQMDSNISVNEGNIQDNEEGIKRVESKAERIAQIMMED